MLIVVARDNMVTFPRLSCRSLLYFCHITRVQILSLREYWADYQLNNFRSGLLHRCTDSWTVAIIASS
jgi:hypothetical protein